MTRAGVKEGCSVVWQLAFWQSMTTWQWQGVMWGSGRIFKVAGANRLELFQNIYHAPWVHVLWQIFKNQRFLRVCDTPIRRLSSVVHGMIWNIFNLVFGNFLYETLLCTPATRRVA
jgi:hypothetical protein